MPLDGLFLPPPRVDPRPVAPSGQSRGFRNSPNCSILPPSSCPPLLFPEIGSEAEKIANLTARHFAGTHRRTHHEMEWFFATTLGTIWHTTFGGITCRKPRRERAV